ncbi:WhiB family transcriptional regulator [Paramicrobacterium fandaimingii]|uniref:WhiB family transcriptional regulator n=1 Tax=Paramicrobacterium fandaimingii TaxID=2708079 RepID=UPI0014240075|nr:WhiB family transcriptional regulator [Microbacterium fandaimingii]
MGALLQLKQYRDEEYEDSIFGDILAELVDRGAPPLPEHLVRYTKPVTRRDLNEAAEGLFLVWLAVDMGGRFRTVATGDDAACSSDGDDWQVFFPEEAGDEDAEAYEATALSICDSCPLRIACLASDWFAAYAEYSNLPVGERGADGVRFHGIVGGFRSYDRVRINTRAEGLRLRYLSGAGRGRAQDPMSAAECAAYERKARSLINHDGTIFPARAGQERKEVDA